jgi:hypothetical protein
LRQLADLPGRRVNAVTVTVTVTVAFVNYIEHSGGKAPGAAGTMPTRARPIGVEAECPHRVGTEIGGGDGAAVGVEDYTVRFGPHRIRAAPVYP